MKTTKNKSRNVKHKINPARNTESEGAVGYLSAMRGSFKDWNQNEKAMSLARAHMHFNARARDIFLSQGYHLPMFLLVNNDGTFVMTTTPSFFQGSDIIELINGLIDTNTYGVIIIVEAWCHLADSKEDATRARIQRQELHIRDLPPSERHESVSVLSESRDGISAATQNVIIRDKSGKPTLLAPFTPDKSGFTGTVINWTKR